jgi:hypothetical protein
VPKSLPAAKGTISPPPPAARYDAGMGKRITIVLAVFALLALLLGTYAGGYLCLSTRYDLPGWGWNGPPEDAPDIVRWYPEDWQVIAFQPAARAESSLRGKRVITYGD